LLSAYLIFAGFTGFPLLFRLYIWVLWKITKSPDFQFILEKPRLCYIALFPARQTRILLVVVILIQFFSTFYPLIVDYNRLEGFNFPQRLLINFFQSVSTRNAGLTAIDISLLRKTTLVLYIA
jgi:Trk-type K+ transport system membrane component